MNFVYVVVGTTGDIPDWTFWHVVAFPTEEAANARRDHLNRWIDERGLRTVYSQPDSNGRTEVISSAKSYTGKPPPWDHQFQHWGSTEYTVARIPFMEEMQ